mmetsp:Transcript_5485/g.8047  ORF Transcript_5485/g.8047 Transcript_5485/m.8047 type:complete len:260 (-) Transcript_5485:376-1155(-)
MGVDKLEAKNAMRLFVLLILQLAFTNAVAHRTSVAFASPSSPRPSASGRDKNKITSPNPPLTQNQLSWQDLGRMLMNLRSDGVPDDVLIGTRYSLPTLSRTRIGSSEIPNAGRGLFASVDCQQGDLLTCYPGDILVHHATGLRNVPDELLEDGDDRLRSLLESNCIGVNEEYGILGLPNLDQDMAYVGHFANDGARPPRNEEDLERYSIESEHIANAQHMPLENLHVVTVALRDIQKDEEILVSYGPEFWVGHSSTWQQ